MVLENKLGITNSADLAKEEEKLSKKRAVELFEKGLLSLADAGSFSSLQKIHEYLFQDIYDFAGKIRTVNIAKGVFVLHLLCICKMQSNILKICHNQLLMK